MTHVHSEDLRLFGAGVLSGPDLLRVDEHLEQCDDCRERAAAGRTTAEIERLIALAGDDPSQPDEVLHRLQEAERAMRQVYRVNATVRTQGLLGRVLVAESWLYVAGGRFSEGLAVAVEARKLFQLIEDEVELARAAVAEAVALKETRDFIPAAGAARQARLLFEKHNETRRATIARVTEAGVLVEAGSYDKAIDLVEPILLMTAADDPFRPYWQLYVAVCLAGLRRDLDRAEGLLDQALATWKFRERSYLRLFALKARVRIAMHRGRYHEALEQLFAIQREAESGQFTAHAMWARCDIADLLALLGRTEESIQHAQAVIEYFAAEKLTRRAQHALALLRDAAERNASVTCHDLRGFRSEFPEEFDQPPIVTDLPPS